VLSAADAVGDMKAGAGAIFYRPDHSMGATIKVVEDAGFVQVVSPNKGIDLGMSARGSSTFETGAFTIHHQDSPRVQVSADSNGESSYRLFGPVNQFGFRPEVKLINGVHGAALELYDTADKLRAVLGNVDLETARTGIVETRPPSSLVLFDKEGKVLWRVP